MIKETNVAYGVRVKLNKNFVEKCLGDKHLMEEEVLFISDSKPYNDEKGQFVNIRGGSLTTSGFAYLDQLDLEFPVPLKPIALNDTQVIVDNDNITIMHKGVEVVMWDQQEWIEDPDFLVPAIANAIKLAYEDIEALKEKLSVIKFKR
jgi:hypothetical protein